MGGEVYADSAVTYRQGPLVGKAPRHALKADACEASFKANACELR